MKEVLRGLLFVLSCTISSMCGMALSIHLVQWAKARGIDLATPLAAILVGVVSVGLAFAAMLAIKCALRKPRDRKPADEEWEDLNGE